MYTHTPRLFKDYVWHDCVVYILFWGAFILHMFWHSMWHLVAFHRHCQASLQMIANGFPKIKEAIRSSRIGWLLKLIYICLYAVACLFSDLQGWPQWTAFIVLQGFARRWKHQEHGPVGKVYWIDRSESETRSNIGFPVRREDSFICDTSVLCKSCCACPVNRKPIAPHQHSERSMRAHVRAHVFGICLFHCCHAISFADLESKI